MLLQKSKKKAQKVKAFTQAQKVKKKDMAQKKNEEKIEVAEEKVRDGDPDKSLDLTNKVREFLYCLLI
ncbi:hypothetical protein TNIN_200441 [Trichonephila inaurata madagascariensis]|uniref:Uncharacterized protein n=1 Tax=Trichonephila inaurata madagascariensis TaxID=2747483 RepID=A0A8X6YH43_9ARAC|nr:hypothetical protein TNIN_200441 [Trichonephila inaurata madagascariensis]